MQSVGDCIDQLLEARIHHLWVVNRNGFPIGCMSMTDLSTLIDSRAHILACFVQLVVARSSSDGSDMTLAVFFCFVSIVAKAPTPAEFFCEPKMQPVYTHSLQFD